MTTALPASIVVDVSVSALGAGASVNRFGTPMIIDTQNIKSATALAPVIGEYTSLRAMVDAGFASYTKAYKLAAQIWRQRKPSPKVIKVASVYALSSAELSAVEDLDPTWYRLLATTVAAGDIGTIATWAQTVATQSYRCSLDTFDVATFGSGTSVKTTLASANDWRTALHCRKANPQTQTLTISAPFVTSNSTVVSVNGVALSPTVFATDSNTTLAALATALQATDAIASATVTNAGGGTDDDREIVIVANDPLVDVVLSGYACTLGASQNTAAFAITDNGAQPLCASEVGYLCSYPAGAATAGLKTFAGIEADSVSQTELTNVNGSGANAYPTLGGGPKLMKGQTSGLIASGAYYFIDTVEAIDRLKEAIEVAALALLAQSPKLAYNQAGINAVGGAIAAVALQFVSDGILEPFDPATAISVPALASIDPSDRTARHLPDVTAEFVGTGAIQSATIVITVRE